MGAGMSPAAIAALHAILFAVVREGGRTDLACGRVLKAYPKLKPSEKAMVVRVAYAIIRRYRLLCALAALPEGAPESPAETARLEAALIALEKRRRTGWPAGFSPDIALKRAALLEKSEPTVFHSMPDWIAEALRRDIGNKWVRVAGAMGEEPKCILRVNTRKGDAASLAKRLGAAKIETRPVDGFPEALEAADRYAALHCAPFEEGLYELQDAGSQSVAPALEVKPGMRVIDACAGEGGKTLHLSNLMGGKGRIIALDVDPKKLETLKKRAARADAQNITTRVVEGLSTWKDLEGTADRVLIDAPCSGSGVFRRQPESKWRLTPEGVAERIAMQAAILDAAAYAAKVGGLVVYATCSLFADENERQVARFIARHKGRFVLRDSRRLLPGCDGDVDGFFIARIERVA